MSSQEPLIVECPRCHTRFRAREDQLAVAGGQVRCGICLALFDSRQAMPAETPETASQDASEADETSLDTPPPDDRQTRWGRPVLLWTGMTVTVAALVFQVFAYQFDRWSSQPQLRGIYEFACGVIGCELPIP